jgi:hypothetical protein
MAKIRTPADQTSAFRKSSPLRSLADENSSGAIYETVPHLRCPYVSGSLMRATLPKSHM